jgi:transposase
MMAPTGDVMRRRPWRKHTPGFKAKVAPAAVKGEKRLAERAQQCDAHPNQIRQRRSELLEGAADVFGSETKSEDVVPAIDVKTLHAKIGKLTLGNEPKVRAANFFSVALGKAGLLSAKR